MGGLGEGKNLLREQRGFPSSQHVRPENLKYYILRTSVYQAAACSIRALACPARACGSFT